LHGQLVQHLRSSYSSKAIQLLHGTWGNFGETRGGVGKNDPVELTVVRLCKDT